MFMLLCKALVLHFIFVDMILKKKKGCINYSPVFLKMVRSLAAQKENKLVTDQILVFVRLKRNWTKNRCGTRL